MSAIEPAEHSAPASVATEVERVARRWHQLPLGHTLSALPTLHALVQGLADEVAISAGMPIQPVPDLGPAVVLDQLRVMVFDYVAAGLDEDELAHGLTHLRRSLP